MSEQRRLRLEGPPQSGMTAEERADADAAVLRELGIDQGGEADRLISLQAIERAVERGVERAVAERLYGVPERE